MTTSSSAVSAALSRAFSTSLALNVTSKTSIAVSIAALALTKAGASWPAFASRMNASVRSRSRRNPAWRSTWIFTGILARGEKSLGSIASRFSSSASAWYRRKDSVRSGGPRGF